MSLGHGAPHWRSCRGATASRLASALGRARCRGWWNDGQRAHRAAAGGGAAPRSPAPPRQSGDRSDGATLPAPTTVLSTRAPTHRLRDAAVRWCENRPHRRTPTARRLHTYE